MRVQEIEDQSLISITSVLFIDFTVTNYPTLLHGLKSGITAHVLNPLEDGIYQITQILKTEYSDNSIREIHIVSHGSPGCLYLGNTQLSLDTLNDYTRDLRAWFHPSGHFCSRQADLPQTRNNTTHSQETGSYPFTLSPSPIPPSPPTPQLLLYACNLAAGNMGAEFITQLHRLTGAEIAASTTPIGHAAIGGKWAFDTVTSGIHPELAFDQKVQAGWLHTLDPFNAEPSYYQVLSGQLHALNIFSGQYEPIGPAQSPSYNATGYNPVDNFIYGLQGGKVIRVHSDGSIENVKDAGGADITPPASQQFAGDVDIDGNYWIRSSANDLVRVDLTTGATQTFNFVGTGNTTADIIALKQVNGDTIFYGVTKNTLIEWILPNGASSGTVSTKTVTGLSDGGSYGAAWISLNGTLNAFNNGSGNIYEITDYLTATPNATVVLSSDPNGSNDGMSSVAQNSIFVVPMIDLDGDNSSGATGYDYQTTFTEGNSGVAIVSPDAVDETLDTRIVDFDSGIVGSSIITLINPQAGDELNVDVGSLPPGISASTSTGSGGEIIVTLTAASGASEADFELALETITFNNTSSSPDVIQRQIDVRLTDLDGNQGATATSFINVVPVNTPPILDLDNDATGANDANYSTSFIEGNVPVAITDGNATIDDIDDISFTSLKVTVGGISDGANEVLRIGSTEIPLDGGSIPSTVTVGGATTYDLAFAGSEIIFTLSGGGEIPEVEAEALLNAIQYENKSANPTGGSRTIDVTINDGVTDSNLATSTITVTTNAATAAWAIAGPSTVDEGGAATFTVSMDTSLLQSGETATVDLAITNVSTSSADYADFNAAVTAAVAAYNSGSNPGSLVWDGTTLAFTSDGTGKMADLEIDLTATDDAFIEGAENFQVTLSNPGSTTGETISLAVGAATVSTIINDTQGAGGAPDGPAEWSISGPAGGDEGSSAQYTLSLSGTFGAGEDATVDLALTDIDTTSTDYADSVAAINAAVAAYAGPGAVSFDGTTLTYTAAADGDSLTPLVIDLPLSDDALLEGPEAFSVDLSNASSSTGADVAIDAAATSVSTTINDTQGDGGPADGPAQWSISGPAAGDEGSSAQYTLGLSGTFGAGEDATVEIALTDIDTTSTDYADYVAAINAAVAAYAGPGTVSFDGTTLTYTAAADGDSLTPLVIDLPLSDDALLEGPEAFSVDLSNASSSTGADVAIDAAATSVSTTINDTQGDGGPADGPAEWSITGPAAGDEGSSAQYTLSLSGTFGAGEDATVEIALTDIDTTSTDYADSVAAINAAVAAYAGPGTVSFDGTTLTYTAAADGDTLTPLVIDLPLSDDVLLEGPEAFSVDLSNASSSTGADVAIDAAAATVSTTINDTQGPGGAPDGPAEWSISGPAAGDEGSSAQYTLSLSGTFGAGEDAAVEITLTDIDTTSADYADSVAAINVAVAAYAGPGTVSFDGTTLTYTAAADGDSLTPLVIDLPLSDDPLLEGPEAFSVDLSNASSSTGADVAMDAAAATVSTTINDTQGPGGAPDGPAEWSISGPAGGDEGSSAQYTLSLSGTFGAGEDATVEIALTDIDTTSTDYADSVAAINAAVAAYAGPGTVSFDGTTLTYTAAADGDSLTPLVIDLPLSDDPLLEGPEAFSVDLSNASSSTGADVAIDAAATSVSTTINDIQGPGGPADGPGEWSISGPVSFSEGDTANYIISLSGSYGAGETAGITVGFTDDMTSDSDLGPAAANQAELFAAIKAIADSRPDLDFNETTGELTFTSQSDGDVMEDIAFALEATEDNIVEADEQFTIALSTPITSTGANVGLDAVNADVQTTVDDNDMAEVSITATDDRAAEDADDGQFTVSLTNPSSTDTVISYTVTGDATPDADYIALSGAVTILAGQTTAVIDVPVLDDLLSEPDETVTVTLTGITSGDDDISIDSTQDTATVTILADTDGDNVPDVDDLDDDNDGIPDVVEVATALNGGDTDGDGILDTLDPDSDEDGVLDVFEAGGTDPDGDGVIGTGPITDTDGDGLDDSVDNLDGGSGPGEVLGGTPLPVTNTDGDSQPDFQDIDDDSDSVHTLFENPDPNGDGNPDDAQDTDGDGTPDYLDVDDDNDEVNSIFENPDPNGDGNPDDAQDTDGDGTPDYLDVDDDNDGVNSEFENPDPNGDGNPDDAQDTDGDGTPDYLDVDDDNDGVNSEFENPDPNGDGNPDDAQDTDGDGTPDYLDVDDDNDGVNSEFENPDPNGDGNPDDAQDTDGDGTPDYLDVDDDNDGVNSIFENPDPNGDGNPDDAQDTDGDGTPDYLDVDDDNDGVNSEFENPDSNGDGNPDDAQDTDGDGTPDYLDVDDDNDGVNSEFENPDSNGDGNPDDAQDTDGDGTPDYLDVDDDNDGVNSEFENPDPNGDGNPDDAQDTDGDGTPDYLDVDDDNDGVNSEFENPDPNGDGNPDDAQDTDGDGTPDYLDVDNDNDGVNSEFENPDPNGDGNPDDAQDTDGDGTPDYLDVDDDNDGVNSEFENPDPNGDGNPDDAQDTDGDGTPDYLDVDDDNDGVNSEFENPDPNGDGNPDDAQDTDGDGTPDYLDVDDDNDGVNSEFENPDSNGDGNPDDAQDTDGDGTPDYLDVDDDNDGVNSIFENPDPNGDGNPDDAQDTDGDGVPDYLDVDDDNDGVNSEFENPDPNGDGNPDDAQDTDGDGVPDYLDVDDDNDGVNSEFENPDPNGDGNPDDAQDTDGDETPDYLDTDDDGDGIVTTLENPDPNGDGNPDDAQDTDGDGVPDYLDIDSDNDGILDKVEGGGDTDGDGIPDFLDLDSDGDSLPDITESGLSPADIAALDADGDGVIDPGNAFGDNGLIDTLETEDTAAGLPDYTGDGTGDAPVDTDGDGQFDFQDLDADNDGIPDVVEATDATTTDSNGDGIIDSTTAADTDGDAVRDYRDLDSDNDSIPDVTEAAATGVASDPDQNALIGSGQIPADSNGNGLADAVEGNPLAIPDTDTDGTPDYRDLDSDNDSASDLAESGNPNVTDADGDNRVDGGDGDGDGLVDLIDGDDALFGSPPGSMPAPVDESGDGNPDFRQGAIGSTGEGTAGADVITGGDGDDIINGLSDTDVLDGGAGNDVVNGGSEPDTVIGGTGDDVLNGGSGDDQMTSGDGNDVANGGSGNDNITGDAGDDLINGGTGNDTLDGGVGQDLLQGNEGQDRLLGGEGDDVLNGGRDSDVLIGGNGADALTGGQGEDHFTYTSVSEFGDTILDFEIVSDRIDLSAIPGATFSALQFQQSGLDTLVNLPVNGTVQTIALLKDVNAVTLDSDNFVVQSTELSLDQADDYLASNPDLIAAFGYNLSAAQAHYAQFGVVEGRPKDTFDEARYLASHPDLIAAFGNNPEAATQHYIQAGFAEGRSTDAFSPELYLAAYPDLQHALGDDIAAATRHYIERGYGEGRDPLLGAAAYIASHEDLIATFGDNLEAGRQHYEQFGRHEGRTISFQADDYIASHGDLIQVFGYNLQAGAEHYIRFGSSEGRAVDAFNEVNYLTTYADVQAVFGNDVQAATRHYIEFGFAEGRTDS